MFEKRVRSLQTGYLWFLFVILSLSSCAPKELVRQPGLEPHAGPVTVEVLKKSIGFRDTKTIKALTDVRIFKNNEPAGSFSGVFGYQAPDSLKTGVFGPFGITIMEFLISKDMLQVYLPPKNILYEMKSPEISFASLVNGKFMYVMQEEDNFYALYAYNGADTTAGPVIKYLFDRPYLLNRRIVLYRDGDAAARIDFDGFNGKVPEKTRLSFINGMDMEFTLLEPEYDTAIPADYFMEIGHDDKKVLPLQDLLKRFAPRR